MDGVVGKRVLSSAVRPKTLPKRRRPAAPRFWSGALISRPAEPADDYLGRIRARLADPRAHLYFDTSFLMWMAKSSAAARAEFLAWLKAVDGGRIHVPLWAAHEFFKHRLKRTVSAELTAEVAKFDAAASSMFDVLSVYASNELFGIVSGVEALVDEYRRAVQPVRSLLTLAAKTSCLDAAVQEVAAFVDRHLLSGPLDQLLEDIEHDERARNRGAVPPAFKDAHKRQRKAVGETDDKATPDNSFGDLVFWREILRHAAGASASATVVLTNDRKTDWFENDHGDVGVPQDLRKVMPRPKAVPRAHPLLIREAFDRGAGELLLIDPSYCAVLFERSGVERRNFVRAALAPSLPDVPGKVAELQKWAGRFGSLARPPGEVDGADLERAQDEAAELDALSLDMAARDSGLPAWTRNYLGYLDDPETRAEALSRFEWHALAKRSLAEIVAIGRGVFEIAETGDAGALTILSDLREQAPTIASFPRQAFFFGALAAAYFDDDLVYRPQSDPAATEILLDLATSDLVAKAVAVLEQGLSATPAIYIPATRAEPVPVEVVIQPSADGKTHADLVAIRVHDSDLVTMTQDDVALRFSTLLQRGTGAFQTAVGPLLAAIARRHRIPRHLIKPSVSPDAVVRVSKFAGIEIDV